MKKAGFPIGNPASKHPSPSYIEQMPKKTGKPHPRLPQFPRHFHLLVSLDNIPYLNIIVVFDILAAFHIRPDLLDVVLKPPERS